MALDPSFYATVKAAINADPALVVLPDNSDGNFEVAAALNAEADPAFYVWKTNVTNAEILQNGMDWTRVDNLSVGKSRIWEWMFQFGYINAAKANVRAGIEAVWVGTAADLAVRASVYGHCQRKASRVEKLLATGAGTTVSNGIGPATMGFEGPITYADVHAARSA